ncbi:MAG: HesA/MoeB/ThiF family protein [Candidatus Binatia bacterium]|nr:HesA/MoeB/ThiF family protein [Candidatus Binatia bacterium]
MSAATGQTVPQVQQGKVLVVGAGGLGSPAALALALTGVGGIGVVDPDAVELSNLQRQILHFTSDLGKPKVTSACEKLGRVAPQLQVTLYHTRLEAGNVAQLFRPYDFIIDGTDSVETKFLVNDGAVLMGKPFCYAGIVQFQGQLLTVVPRQSACLRCLFPTPPDPAEIPTCQESGILGSLAGSIGFLQAQAALEYLQGNVTFLADRLLTYDAHALRWRFVPVRRNLRCPLCGLSPTITDLHALTSRWTDQCTARA